MLYEITAVREQELKNIFQHHPPHGDQAERYGEVRRECFDLACRLETLCPPSRERSLALTSLQQTMMWANAAIAITEKPASGKV